MSRQDVRTQISRLLEPLFKHSKVHAETGPALDEVLDLEAKVREDAKKEKNKPAPTTCEEQKCRSHLKAKVNAQCVFCDAML